MNRGGLRVTRWRTTCYGGRCRQGECYGAATEATTDLILAPRQTTSWRVECRRRGGEVLRYRVESQSIGRRKLRWRRIRLLHAEVVRPRWIRPRRRGGFDRGAEVVRPRWIRPRRLIPTPT
ncbi:unnamed protein product [Arabis nemorensis]|uniref:Uncharacterized protein n=1 Tax=Arabis nemorensis TaxID=586526 RepID=A0A565BAQ6_9BRAS|nr:unnamed protein product [Arabis nemorensis]